MAEKLTDDLLAEILHRLPYKDSRRCLCVCKSWSLLLSQTSFLEKLMAFHRRRPNQLHHQQPHYAILNFTNNNEFGDQCCGRQDNDSKALPVLHRSLDFLPNREGEEVRVLRVSGDLLLCGHSKKSFRPKRAYSGSMDDYYYVCNVITKQWVALPPRPRNCPKNFQFHSSRFYTEQEEDPNDSIYNPEYEYIVLVMDAGRNEMCFPSSPFKLEVFSSKDKVWRTLRLWVPRDFYFLGGSWLRESCFHEGILWYSNEIRVLRINIKDAQDKPRLIDFPREMSCLDDYAIQCENIGVCNGRLRLSRCYKFPFFATITSHVMVWELVEEEGEGKWRFVHKVPIGDVFFHPISMFIKDGTNNNNNNNVGVQILIRNIRFHPNDPDILFLEQDKCIVEWNARTRDFKHYPEAVPFFGRLLLTPPLYPTPVLPLNDTHQKNCVFDPPILPVLASIWEQVDFFSVLQNNLQIV